MEYKIENGGIQLNFKLYKKGDTIDVDPDFAKELQEKDPHLVLKEVKPTQKNDKL